LLEKGSSGYGSIIEAVGGKHCRERSSVQRRSLRFGKCLYKN